MFVDHYKKIYTREIRSLKGDDKLKLVIKLRIRINDIHGANSAARIALDTGLAEQTVENFITERVTLPQPATISALMSYALSADRANTAPVAPKQVRRERQPIRSQLRAKRRAKMHPYRQQRRHERVRA